MGDSHPTVGRSGLTEVEEQRPDDTEEEAKEGAEHSPEGQRGEAQPEQDPVPIQR